HRFEQTYRRLLDFVLRRTRSVLMLFVAAFVSSMVGISTFLWPPEFFSDADRNQFLIEVFMPAGTAVEETDRVMQQLEAWISEQPELKDYAAFIGAGAPKFYYNQFTERRGENVGMFIVNTTAQVSPHETRAVADRFGVALQRLAPAAFVRSVTLKQGYGGGSDIEIYIQGDDLNVLRALAAKVRDIAKQIDGVKATSDSFGYDPVTIETRIDSARANLYGISHQEIATTLQTAIDGRVATSFREADEEIPIVVRVRQDQRDGLEDLQSLPLVSPSTSNVIPLAQIAELVPGFTNQQIVRWHRKREAFVGLDVSSRSLFAVAREVERAVSDAVSMPEGYDISFFGQQAEVTESFASLARATVIAVFLIYIVLVIRFHSLTQPMLIILAIPMALIGSTWGLVFSGHPLSFTAFLGMISLTGIVVNDSIVLLDYINTLRRRGMNLEDAVTQGATTRLRAVTLTSVTTIAGLLPLSISGGDFFGPFGFAMIGGLAASTILTLAVQPAAYLALERRRTRDWAPENDHVVTATAEPRLQ
ncbi:MAG: efflux RND transporter permease subunit, partial [Gammaproteobacteria bacterium]|nr:efflux RND transporter permease subunit [Gammaproteobacteria bacterium]